jgi:hypothetical protein
MNAIWGFTPFVSFVVKLDLVALQLFGISQLSRVPRGVAW